MTTRRAKVLSACALSTICVSKGVAQGSYAGLSAGAGSLDAKRTIYATHDVVGTYNIHKIEDRTVSSESPLINAIFGWRGAYNQLALGLEGTVGWSHYTLRKETSVPNKTDEKVVNRLSKDWGVSAMAVLGYLFPQAWTLAGKIGFEGGWFDQTWADWQQGVQTRKHTEDVFGTAFAIGFLVEKKFGPAAVRLDYTFCEYGNLRNAFTQAEDSRYDLKEHTDKPRTHAVTLGVVWYF